MSQYSAPIYEWVESIYGISKKDIVSGSRKPNVVKARKATIFLLSRYIGMKNFRVADVLKVEESYVYRVLKEFDPVYLFEMLHKTFYRFTPEETVIAIPIIESAISTRLRQNMGL